MGGVVESMLRQIRRDKQLPRPYRDGTTLFQDVQVVYENDKRRGRLGQSMHEIPSGALVISNSLDSGMQRYSLCRRLDVTGELSISRMGSSLQIYTPIIDEVFERADAGKSEDKGKRDSSGEDSFINMVLNADTRYSNIMFTTPALLSAILDEKLPHAPFDINPRIIVLDQFDTLLAYLIVGEHEVGLQNCANPRSTSSTTSPALATTICTRPTSSVKYFISLFTSTRSSY